MEQSEVGLAVHWHRHQQFLRRTLVFLVTVSVCSMFVWLSSGLSALPDSFNVYFNTCLLSSILTHTLERKYMFLICNGILAFLAKTSARHSVSTSPSSYTLLPPVDPQLSLAPSLYSSPRPSLMSDQQLQLVTSIEEQEQEIEQEHEDEDGEEEEEEDDDNKGSDEEVVSTEELNRRIEEFIRKMKQDIRIEAQQQLIAV